MERAPFERLVEEAIDLLPDAALDVLDNVAIIVEDDSEHGDRLGEYLGVPRTERSILDIAPLPDVIYLYQFAIEDEVGDDDPDLLREEIRRTLWHEIAHHLGWEEDHLDEAEERRGYRPDNQNAADA